MVVIGKTINTILNLTDKFTPKLSQAGKQALIFKAQLSNCNQAASSIDSGLNKLSKTVVATGAAGVAAMGAFAKASLESYKGFQQSMSNVAGIMSIDTASETYAKMEKAARDAGKSTTKTAQESADALSYMALAGWSVEDSLNGLMPILRASEATGADLATTSDLVTDSMSALGLQTKDLNHYLDVCARAQNKSNTTLTQMQEAYINAGGTFKTFNTPIEESGALLGILANRGIKGSEAGVKLQSTLVNLTKKSGESAKAMAAIGVSAYDSQGKFKGVTNVLREVQAATASMTEEERNNYLTMIAGKTQLTTLNALMAGLNNTLEDGTNEYQALYNELSNCEGSLSRMADTMTNNYAGALARAGSALDDFKINIGKKLEPYATQFFNWFAEKLPGATEKFSVWLDTNLPKAINFCKAAFENIKPVMVFILNHFKALTSVGIGLVTGLKAFSIITRVVTLMNRLKNTETALKAIQIALNTSILSCPITWVATGIAAVTAGLLLYRNAIDKAMERDIASHFGDIALSAEECANMVKNVFSNDIIDRADDLQYAWNKVNDSIKGLSDSANELNKLTFLIQLNPDNVSRDEYLQTAQGYIDNMQDALKNKQFELALDLKFILGDSSEAASLINGSNEYWTQLLTNAQSLGQELVDSIAKGYENGWDEQSMDMVVKGLQKMSEIQEKIKSAQAEANMELLTEDFMMSDLSQESFDMYIEKLNEQGNALTEAAKTAASNAIAAQKLMLEDGAITQDLYDSNVKAITDGYQKQAAESLNSVLSESMRAIKEVYGDELGAVAEQINADISGAFQIDQNDLDASMGELQFAIENSIAKVELSSGTKKKIESFMETLMPSANELHKMATKDQSLWKVYGDTLTGVEALKTLTGKGELMGNAVLSGANSAGVLSDATKAGQTIKNALIKPFSEKTKVTLNLDIAYKTNSQTSDLYNKAKKETDSRSTKNTIRRTSNPWAGLLDFNATGTNYYGGGFTYINEHGGEIVDLPTGTRIYPADKSEKMMEGKPSISVNINVQGNIFGMENAAEIIGDMVCEKILDTVRAV